MALWAATLILIFAAPAGAQHACNFSDGEAVHCVVHADFINGYPGCFDYKGSFMLAGILQNGSGLIRVTRLDEKFPDRCSHNLSFIEGTDYQFRTHFAGCEGEGGATLSDGVLTYLEYGVPASVGLSPGPSPPWAPLPKDEEAFDFDHVMYHAEMIDGPASPHIALGDVLLWTGHLSEGGGDVTVECLNETAEHRCAHTLHFGGPFLWNPSTQLYQRTFVGVLGDETSTVEGYLTFQIGAPSPRPLYRVTPPPPARVYKIGFVMGPIPPPRPPQCEEAYTHTHCREVSGCTWCRSNDGLHELCFVRNGLQDAKAWSCEPEQPGLLGSRPFFL